MISITTTRTCLKVFDGPAVRWTEAIAICKQDGGDLINITTKLKWDFLYGYIKCVDAAWIGLRNKIWINRESFVNVYNIQLKLNDFDSGYTHDTDSSCAILSTNLIEKSLLDNSCNIKQIHYFVCELDI